MWDGKERREEPMHMQPLAECVERYKHIVDKLDGIAQRLDKINGRYEKHLEEAIPYRSVVDSHKDKFTQMETHRRWVIGIQVTTMIAIFIQIVGFFYLYGGLNKQVDINTSRWDKLIESKIHPEVR
jgi:hypothetical protein